MSDAPTDGTVIEALIDGEWHLVYWSENADDMSPYGTPGWAREADRLLMLDLEGWRELPEGEDRTIDDNGEREAAAASAAAAREQIAAADARDARRASRARTAQRRTVLEAKYAALTGTTAPKLFLRGLRAEVRALDRADSLRRLTEVLSTLQDRTTT
ncbi:hypothetical protein [Microbacterium sp. 77mftsu3.1]|uniref:hypothetical protein n=1 Tax=Microbacterium sp. 77mftsu3.1 TaxID=1761802 RepID=UPI00039ECDD5|nr:hypothetical protein [Microbacterium sp. 77mftsu3.1]SDH47619.1 hypothetical protein SAMN04488590_3387 [Microbacterium sp. 77mftsu3.1]